MCVWRFDFERSSTRIHTTRDLRQAEDWTSRTVRCVAHTTGQLGIIRLNGSIGISMRFVQEATIVTIVAWSFISSTYAQAPAFQSQHTNRSTAPPPAFRFTRLPPITSTQQSMAQVGLPAKRPQVPIHQVAVTNNLAEICAWWEHHVSQPHQPGANTIGVTANDLITQALAQSDHIVAVSQGPLIEQENILRAVADFDPSVFFESRWDDLSDPVGNTLTTGGPTRYNDHHLFSKGGLRQRTRVGGTVELAQEVGLQDTNSLFFVPDQQAATRTTLSFNQPLLRKAGREYNESAILLAEIQTNIAHHELSRELQDHAFRVIQAYWDLYLQRALFLQRQRAHEQAVRIHAELKGREQLDSLKSQIARARASVAIRRANVQRAALSTRSAQSRIVNLTNNQLWRQGTAIELTPVEAPATTRSPVDVQTAFQTALHLRPEVAQQMERIQEAQVRLGISKNELLPQLDLVVETYVAGLDGDYDVSDAVGSQFADGAPSYSVGILFQVPIGNRAAQAECRRREAQVAQLMAELNNTLSEVSLEVEIASAEVEAAYEELNGRYEAMLATDEELKYLFDRWRLLPGEDRAVSFVLEELLDAQDRQMEAESSFVRAQVAHTISHFNLQRVSGSLLHFGQPLHYTQANHRQSDWANSGGQQQLPHPAASVQ